MYVLVPSKNKEDRNKNEGARVATTLNIDFSNTQGQLTQTLKGSQRSDLAEIRTHPTYYSCSCYLQE